MFLNVFINYFNKKETLYFLNNDYYTLIYTLIFFNQQINRHTCAKKFKISYLEIIFNQPQVIDYNFVIFKSYNFKMDWNIALYYVKELKYIYNY